MKKNILFIICLIILFLLPTPPYKELNHLILIHSLQINCKEKEYELILKEIIPMKEDNGIQYKYKTYQKIGANLSTMKKEIEEKEKKRFYYKGVKQITTNCPNPKEILSTFQISPKKVKIKTETNHS